MKCRDGFASPLIIASAFIIGSFLLGTYTLSESQLLSRVLSKNASIRQAPQPEWLRQRRALNRVHQRTPEENDDTETSEFPEAHSGQIGIDTPPEDAPKAEEEQLRLPTTAEDAPDLEARQLEIPATPEDAVETVEQQTEIPTTLEDLPEADEQSMPIPTTPEDVTEAEQKQMRIPTTPEDVPEAEEQQMKIPTTAEDVPTTAENVPETEEQEMKIPTTREDSPETEDQRMKFPSTPEDAPEVEEQQMKMPTTPEDAPESSGEPQMKLPATPEDAPERGEQPLTLSNVPEDASEREEGQVEIRSRAQELMEEREQTEKSAEGGNPFSRVVKAGGLVAGFQSDVCGMSEEELGAALRLEHGRGSNEQRYFYGGRWMTWSEFSDKSLEVAEGSVACVVVHVADQMPCVGAENGCVLHFYVRPHDTDVKVLRQLVEKEELEKLDPRAGFETILDGGGNCGVSAVLFATMYPNAQIVSVEPGQGSYELLRMNTRQFPNVMAVHAGLWNKVTQLAFYGASNEAWGMQVTEWSGGKLPKGTVATLDGISIPFLLRLYGLDHFDFIKIDIEGSEKEVFQPTKRNNLSYLEKVKVAAIEVHEKFRRGARQAVVDAFEPTFDVTKSGEYCFYTKKTSERVAMLPLPLN